MRITFISLMEGFPWGGSEELWYRAAALAINRGHKVQVCVKEFFPEHSKISALRKLGATVLKRKKTSYLHRMLRKLNLIFSPSYLSDVKGFSPDYIVISGGGSLDYFDNDALFKYVDGASTPFLLISQFYPEYGIVSPNTSKRLRSSHNFWKKYYFVSQRNLDTVQRNLAFRLQNTEIIDNPVNISKVGIAKWPASKMIHVACVARYDVICKGQDRLIEVLASVEFKNVEFKLNFYGSGPDKDYLKQLVSFYELEDKISVNDHIENVDEVWEHHHALVLPSIAEGTPLALQECLLKGRTALVTDVGGNDTLIIDGETGFLIPPLSQKLLKQNLVKLFNTPLDKLELMGKKAFDYISYKIDLRPELKIIAEIENCGDK